MNLCSSGQSGVKEWHGFSWIYVTSCTEINSQGKEKVREKL